MEASSKTSHDQGQDSLYQDVAGIQNRPYPRRGGETHFKLLRSAVLATIASQVECTTDLNTDSSCQLPTSFATSSCSGGPFGHEGSADINRELNNSDHSPKRCRRVSYPSLWAQDQTEPSDTLQSEVVVSLEGLNCRDNQVSTAKTGKRRVSIHHND